MSDIETTNLNKQVRELGSDIVDTIKKILQSENKIATGNLIQSLDYKVIEVIGKIFLEITAADYFQFVDKGRRPGKMPPIKPIKSWMSAKGIVSKNKSLPFLIARSIGKKGIKPTNVKQRAIKEVMKNVDKVLKKGAVKDIEKWIDQNFKSVMKEI